VSRNFFARPERKDVTADHADAAGLGGTCFRTSSITIRLTIYFHSDAKTPRIGKRTALAETFISAERGGAMPSAKSAFPSCFRLGQFATL
jgi:hypothetical protein